MLAVALALVLAVVRILGSAGHSFVVEWWAPVAYLWHDAVVVLLFAAFERGVRSRLLSSGLRPAQRSRSDPGRRWLVRGVYAIAASYAVFNIPVERALWSPLTWPMWRAAGGPLADSIRHYATWTNAVLVAAGLTVVALAPRVSRSIPARPVLAALVACAALGPWAAARVDTQGRERNAWSALAAAAVPDTIATSAARDWRASELEIADVDLGRLRAAAAGRNVMVVSLESTAARYLGLYGAGEDVAPHLTALARSGVVFDNAYAVYPESIKGLFSTLCSITPPLATAADSFADLPCRSIAAVLRDRGYRTALFHSGRFGYLGMQAVIAGRGYDVLADAGDIGGAHDSSFGIDEPSTVASILGWIDAGQPGRPFFVTYLPIAGHHPYETPERGPFPDRDEFGRYRNALHYGDAALGALRRGLEARGLDRHTLWIVFADHGEGFGQHEGNYGHTFQLFDENVRVPFVVAAPGLIPEPIHAHRIVSLLDAAPTITDLLGVAAPAVYQGRSVLDPRPRVALFFTDYSLPLAGLRDGSRKIIHDLRSGRSHWFDVEHDPGETHDLRATHTAEIRRYAATLEGWLASVRSRHEP